MGARLAYVAAACPMFVAGCAQFEKDFVIDAGADDVAVLNNDAGSDASSDDGSGANDQHATEPESGIDSSTDSASNGCPVSACLPGAVCQTDGAGNKTCLKTCTDTNSAPCGASLVCAPLTDPSGNPIGPYVCKPNDGHSYDGCGPAFCNGCATSGFSCEKAGANNTIYYCGKNCSVNADCRAPAGVCCLPMKACGFCVGTCSSGVCGPC
jgi:hypothetical protein